MILIQKTSRSTLTTSVVDTAKEWNLHSLSVDLTMSCTSRGTINSKRKKSKLSMLDYDSYTNQAHFKVLYIENHTSFHLLQGHGTVK